MGSDGRVSKDGRVINVESGEGKAVLIKNDILIHFNGLCILTKFMSRLSLKSFLIFERLFYMIFNIKTI